MLEYVEIAISRWTESRMILIGRKAGTMTVPALFPMEKVKMHRPSKSFALSNAISLLLRSTVPTVLSSNTTTKSPTLAR